MSRRDLENIRLIYESSNERSFVIGLDDDYNKKFSLEIPKSLERSLRSMNDDGIYLFQRFHKERDPENFPNITDRKFSVQTYDDNEIRYLKDEEDADIWLNNEGDLRDILKRIVTFGFDYDGLKRNFPNLTPEDYKWLSSLI